MTENYLTDDEKLKLELLLADVDEVEDIPESQSNQIRTDDSNKSSTILVKDSVSDDDGVGTEDDKKITLNGFKYYSDERILLNNIDEKLKELSEQYSSLNKRFSDCFCNVTKGNNLKVSVMKGRIEEIDRDLDLIQKEKMKENLKLKESIAAKKDGDMLRTVEEICKDLQDDGGDIDSDDLNKLDSILHCATIYD